LVPTLGVTEPRHQDSRIYRVEISASLDDDAVSSQLEASNSHDKLHNLFEHVEQPEMDRAYIELAKE